MGGTLSFCLLSFQKAIAGSLHPSPAQGADRQAGCRKNSRLMALGGGPGTGRPGPGGSEGRREGTRVPSAEPTAPLFVWRCQQHTNCFPAAAWRPEGLPDGFSRWEEGCCRFSSLPTSLLTLMMVVVVLMMLSLVARGEELALITERPAARPPGSLLIKARSLRLHTAWGKL